MAIGDPVTQPIPAVGTPGTGYASQLVAFLQEMKSRVSSKVPLSSLLVGLFDMANNAIENLSYVALYPQVSLPATPTGSMQNYGGDVYWVGNSGAVRITNGATLNAASLKGITGDYGSPNPAELKFVDLNQEYYAYDDAAGLAWAHFAARDFDIYGGYTSINRVRLTWAGSTSYTMTLPAAVPASSQPLVMDNTGALTTGSSFGMQSGANITLSGAGTYKHGTKTVTRAIKSAETYFTGGSLSNVPPGGILGVTSTGYIPLPDLPKHARILNVSLYYGSAANAAACTAQLTETSDAVPCVAGFTDIPGAFLTPGGSSIGTYSGINKQYTNAGSLWIKITNSTGGERISAVSVDYDVP